MALKKGQVILVNGWPGGMFRSCSEFKHVEFIMCLLPHPESDRLCTPSPTAQSQALFYPKGESLVCAVPGVVLGLVSVC